MVLSTRPFSVSHPVNIFLSILMALSITHVSLPSFSSFHRNRTLPKIFHRYLRPTTTLTYSSSLNSIQCSANPDTKTLRTCKNCKTQFDPLLNHPRACRFHTAHFGGNPLHFSFSFQLICHSISSLILIKTRVSKFKLLFRESNSVDDLCYDHFGNCMCDNPVTD